MIKTWPTIFIEKHTNLEQNKVETVYILSKFCSIMARMKKIMFLLLAFCYLLSAHSQERKKVGLVLSGGGAKGVAHVKVLEVLEEAGIPIDYIAGTSMGAIVGGLYAIGYTPHQLDSMIKTQDWTYLLSDATKRSIKTFVEKEDDSKYVISLPFNRKPKEVVPDGIIKGLNLETLFTALTIGYHDSIDYKKLPIPYACVAVDLVKGEEVVFHSGKLAESMRASMAIPAAFTPVRKDSMVLVDGGLLNNFPVDVALAMGADLIIGVDVQNDPATKEKLVSLTDMVSKMSDMLSEEKLNDNMKHVDLHIKVDVKGYNAASFSQVAIDTLMQRGEMAARDQWDNILRFKKKVGVSADYVPGKDISYQFLSETNPVFIRNITFPDIVDDPQRLLKKCKLKENSKLTMKDLTNAVAQLYATQIYTNVNYTLNEIPEGYDLAFSMEDNRMNYFRLGLRFDNEEVASILLNATYHFKTDIPTTGAVTARFGKRAGVQFDYSILPNPLRFFNISYAFQHDDINIYNAGKRVYNTTYNRHVGDVGYSNIFNQDLKFGVGLRYQYYHYKDFLYNRADDNLIVKPEGFFSYYALIRYETMNKKIYPAHGTSLQGDISVYTDNMYQYNGESPFAAISLWWKTVYSLSNRFVIIPSVYGRVLLGDNIPYPFLNAIGGDVPSRYVSQQAPFEGINYMEITDNSLAVVSVRLRQRMWKNNYVYLTTNYGLTDNKVKNILSGRQLFGTALTYGYNSIFGPIEASLNYSNRTKQLGFYLNVGYKF